MVTWLGGVIWGIVSGSDDDNRRGRRRNKKGGLRVGELAEEADQGV